MPVITYTHSSGRFSIGYPDNWEYLERPNGAFFVEPGDQAGYSVVFSDVGETYSDQELNQYLVTFVAENFLGEEAGFEPISQEQQADGWVVAQFAAKNPRPISSPDLGRTINEVRVRQQETIVFLLLINVAEEQWEISQDELHALAATFTPLDTAPLVIPTPTTSNAPPEWVLIGPTGKTFAFLYPSDWEIIHQDALSVTVAMPELEFRFEAGTVEWPNAGDNPLLAEQTALAYLAAISKTGVYTDLRSLPPAEFPLDKMTGITVDFLYKANGVEMAGSIITAAQGERIYRVTFTAPADLYQFALQWFNPMYKSFRILDPELIITVEPP
jgi:hypothetical protein